MLTTMLYVDVSTFPPSVTELSAVNNVCFVSGAVLLYLEKQQGKSL